MIARKYSLKGDKRFEAVKKEGKMRQASSFGMAYLKRKDDEHPLFGFIVSLKISKDSVMRNRIKRAMSEAVRFLAPDIKNGYDVVFLAKPGSLKNSTDQIMREVKETLIKAKLL